MLGGPRLRPDHTRALLSRLSGGACCRWNEHTAIVVHPRQSPQNGGTTFQFQGVGVVCGESRSAHATLKPASWSVKHTPLRGSRLRTG